MQIGNPPPTGTQTTGPLPSAHFLSSIEGELTLAVIALGTLIIIALSIVLRAKNALPDDAIRGYSIILIITGTMVLICAGYSNDQIAPAMGLFGTLAGYLLGRKAGQP
jgi:hypothetical protein